MVEARWGRRLGPASLALVGALGIASTTPRRAGRGRRDRRRIARRTRRRRRDRATGAPWFRLEPTLVDGARRGQRLDVGRGRAAAWTSGPRPGVVRRRDRSAAGSSSARTMGDARRCRVVDTARWLLDDRRDVDRRHPARDRGARRHDALRVPRAAAPIARTWGSGGGSLGGRDGRARAAAARRRRGLRTDLADGARLVDRRASAVVELLRARSPAACASSISTTGRCGPSPTPGSARSSGWSMTHSSSAVPAAACPAPSSRIDLATGRDRRCSTTAAGARRAAARRRRPAGRRPGSDRWQRAPRVDRPAAGRCRGDDRRRAGIPSPWQPAGVRRRAATRLVHRRRPDRPAHAPVRRSHPPPARGGRPMIRIPSRRRHRLAVARRRPSSSSARGTGPRPRPGPGPRPGLGGRRDPDLPLALRRRAGRRHQDGHPRGGDRQQRHEGVPGGDLHLRSQRARPHRLRRRARRAGSTASAASPGTRRTAGSRCGCASTAGPSTGARSSGARCTPARPTAATTPRPSRSTSSGTSRAWTTT